MNESQIEQTQQGEEMNIGEVVYTETEALQKIVPFDSAGAVVASLGRIEDAVTKRIAELKSEAMSAYDRGWLSQEQAKEGMKKRIDDLMQAYRAGIDQKKRIAELEKRITELEGALEDISTYATIETPEVVMEIINGMLNK